MTMRTISGAIRPILGAVAGLILFAGTAYSQEVNYDESKVGTYTLEDPLRFANGKKVRNAKDWELRRQEILEIFQSEMFGRIPDASPIYLEKLEEGPTLGGYATRRQIRMWFNEEHTGTKVDWLIVTPNFVEGPCPTIMLYNYQGNHTILPDPEIAVNTAWQRDDATFGVENHHATEKGRGVYAGPQTHRTVYPLPMILARGYAFVTACYADISPDPDHIRTEFPTPKSQEVFARQGIFDMWGPVDTTRKDNTTSIGAWAWVLMRGMDMIEQIPELDKDRVLLTGSSRLGKTALLAGAYDDRFAVVVTNQTGGGGVPLAKRNYGESISTEVVNFPHWFCRAYDKYAGHEDTMPFDQHLLVACIAPRPLLVEGFNQGWFDTKGEFLSLQAASPVWKKFRGSGLPNVEWPKEYDTCAIGEYLGYVRRDLDHGIAAVDWTWMMDFADKHFGK